MLDFTGHFNTVLDRNPGGKGRIRHFEPNFMWHVLIYPLLDSSAEILCLFKSFQYITLCAPIGTIQLSTFVHYRIPLFSCMDLEPKSVQWRGCYFKWFQWHRHIIRGLHLDAKLLAFTVTVPIWPTLTWRGWINSISQVLSGSHAVGFQTGQGHT